MFRREPQAWSARCVPGTTRAELRFQRMTRFVRCIDNTLAKDLLKVGKVYEVLQVKERDGYYVLPLGRFTMARFRPVSAAEAATADAEGEPYWRKSRVVQEL